MPTISINPAIQAAYDEMIANGVSHTLAEMFALRQPPMSNTDREFLAGLGTNGSQFAENPAAGDYYKSVAKEKGMDITGKIYIGGLAEYPGDPQAWVTGRGDIRRRCEEKGWGCEGTVSLPVKNIAPRKEKYEVAADLVEEYAQSAVIDNPDLARKDPGELRHEIKESLKPDWS